jgi:hypothetical protein
VRSTEKLTNTWPTPCFTHTGLPDCGRYVPRGPRLHHLGHLKQLHPSFEHRGCASSRIPKRLATTPSIANSASFTAAFKNESTDCRTPRDAQIAGLYAALACQRCPWRNYCSHHPSVDSDRESASSKDTAQNRGKMSKPRLEFANSHSSSLLFLRLHLRPPSALRRRDPLATSC